MFANISTILDIVSFYEIQIWSATSLRVRRHCPRYVEWMSITRVSHRDANMKFSGSPPHASINYYCSNLHSHDWWVTHCLKIISLSPVGKKIPSGAICVNITFSNLTSIRMNYAVIGHAMFWIMNVLTLTSLEDSFSLFKLSMASFSQTTGPRKSFICTS